MKTYLLILFFIIDSVVVFSQNMTIEKNKFFKNDGYILYYVLADTTFLDADNAIRDANYGKVFISGQSVFLDSLCNLFKFFTNQGYMKNEKKFINEILKLSYYLFPQRPFGDCIHYPEKEKIESISSYIAYRIADDTLTLRNIKPGIYFRIIKVKMEGWLMEFHNYRQLKSCYAHTSLDENGKIRITPTILKDFEPAFRIYKEPYIVVYPKKVLFYSDWILSPIVADVIKPFYKYLYIGPKKKKHISYPKALKYLKKHDELFW